MPGLTVVDVEPTLAFDRSCTAAVQEKLGTAAWEALALDEIDRARAGGADTLATIYHGCQRLMCGLERKRPITIEHYLSVFARGLGIEFEDKYKRYLLSGDTEAILEEMTPCQQADRVDPARARDSWRSLAPGRPGGRRHRVLRRDAARLAAPSAGRSSTRTTGERRVPVPSHARKPPVEGSRPSRRRIPSSPAALTPRPPTRYLLVATAPRPRGTGVGRYRSSLRAANGRIPISFARGGSLCLTSRPSFY